MAWFEWPFIISSVLTQMSIGAFIVLGMVLLSGKLCFGQADRLHKAMLVLWLMLFSALLLRELNLMLTHVDEGYRIGVEVLLAIMFFAIALFYWFVEKALIGSDLFRKCCLVLAIFIGGSYLIHGLVMRSDQWLVTLHFFATALCGGTLLAHACLVRAQHKVEELNTLLPRLGAIIAVICLLTGLPQLGELSRQIDTTGVMMPFISQAISLGLLLAAVGVWLMPLVTKSKPILGVLTFALSLSMVSSYFAGVGY
ncbi:dimethyl sulfoxide reductase anchor subunit [Photobacterium sp. ZSDE20]|uniref:Dimethyl sulfoxide reductase anchor subunit n=1 Tax=Photobacterium pectinilyticum TaxID=2906793 RepID=A0ABT1N0T4_9GAMM|nr:DmsC/YnfH family molybdoenzyme membrane anchor subunit [Photobacterium sp. ZSDE20]MCQ1056874.1 dimethyl sulfoxide reductase anchor subunit [Photobacterium sp. ZSDE20]MDD1821009.1 dimethyl sulfoxide reductase anchor subunit [Photobacterium sp. ZSDE20]